MNKASKAQKIPNKSTQCTLDLGSCFGYLTALFGAGLAIINKTG